MPIREMRYGHSPYVSATLPHRGSCALFASGPPEQMLLATNVPLLSRYCNWVIARSSIRVRLETAATRPVSNVDPRLIAWPVTVRLGEATAPAPPGNTAPGASPWMQVWPLLELPFRLSRGTGSVSR